jgi:hypothetical protein
MKNLTILFYLLFCPFSILDAQTRVPIPPRVLTLAKTAALKLILIKYVNKLRIKKSSLLRSNYRECRLHSTEFIDFAQKLKDLKDEFKNKQCLDRMGSTIKNLGESITKMEKIQSQIKKDKISKEQYEDKLNKLKDPDYKAKRNEIIELEDKRGLEMQQKRMRIMSNSISTIARLASSSECQKDLKKSDTLDIFGDIIVNTTQIGFLTPTRQGYMTAAGGTAIGSIFKFLAILLKSEYDFSKEEDRKAYIKLNCGYHNLLGEIDDAGMLTEKSKEHERERVERSVQVKKINEHIGRLQNILKFYNQGIKEKFKNLWHKELGVELTNLILNIELLNADLYSEELFSKKRSVKGQMLENIFELHGKISEGLKISKNKNLISFSNRYDKQDYNNIVSNFPSKARNVKTKTDFADLLLKESDYTDALEKLRDSMTMDLDWIYPHLKQIELIKVYKNRSILDKAFDIKRLQASLLLARFLGLKKQYLGRISFLNRVQIGNMFEKDKGHATKLSVLKNIQEIQEIIYGKKGRAFIYYIITKVGDDSFEDFENEGQNFGEMLKNNYNDIKDPKTTEHTQFCALVNRLRLSFQRGKTATQVGMEYMETNGHMFYKDQQFFNWVVWTDGWYKNQIFEQYKTYTKAKKDLNLNIKTMTIPARSPKKGIVKFYKKEDSLGTLMYRMARAKFIYNKGIMKYKKKAGCQRFQ